VTNAPVSDPQIPFNLNPRVQSLRPSATLAMNERSAQLVREGRPVYRLGFGQSPFPIPPSLVAALQANAQQRDYLPVKGLRELRTAVADFHQRRYGLATTAADVLIGPGSKELIFLAQLVYQGELLVPAPSWVSYAPQAQLAGQSVRWLQTERQDGWRLRPETLEAACAKAAPHPRVLVLNFPNNPTGLTLGDDELAALAAVARKYRLLVISDEIYGELQHAGEHVSLARHYPEGTLVTSGLSKWCGAGGWRLGVCCFPPDLRWLQDAMAVVAGETFSAVAAPIQYAAVTAYSESTELDHYLFQARRILRALGQWVSRRLQAAGVAVDLPQGAFYFFPDFTPHAASLHARGMQTSVELCERLLNETGVALLPGSDFGRPATEFTCRLAYVDFAGAACLRAAERVPNDEELSEQWVVEHCGNVSAAVDALVGWLR
jgi:aspartate aminotransferase